MPPNHKRFLSIDDLEHQVAPAWLIKDLFEVNSLTMLAGPAGSYKSFLALDWQLSMATHRQWCGRPTAPAKVLYALGEGKAALLKRVGAWTHYHQLSADETKLLNENFKVSFDVPQLAIKASVDNMLHQLEVEQYQPNVIVIDTLARSFVGLDENSQKDVGLWIDQADRLRHLGYTVIVIHHTAKNTEFGVKFRGSSAIIGAMDTAMTMVRESPTSDRVTVTTTKQKEHDEGNPLYFQRIQVTPPRFTESSIVLVPAIAKDERFTTENQALDLRIKALLKEPFESDRARARILAVEFNLSDGAAATKISRYRKEMPPPDAPVEG